MKNIFLFFLRIYKVVVSPFVSPACRFYPPCSEYMHQAVTKYGLGKGVILGIRRLFRCHPFHPGGYDPLI